MTLTDLITAGTVTGVKGVQLKQLDPLTLRVGDILRETSIVWSGCWGEFIIIKITVDGTYTARTLVVSSNWGDSDRVFSNPIADLSRYSAHWTVERYE